MKMYLYYAATLLVLGVLACIYIFQKAKNEKPGDATLDFIFFVIIGEIAALALGYAVMILWRKYVAHDPDVSRYSLYASIFILVGMIYSVLQIGFQLITAYLTSKK